MNHSPVHFEIPADDPQKLANFYTNLFGWQIEKYSGGNVDYWMVRTAPQGEGMNGGMMARQAPGQQMVVYFSVESVAEYAKKAESLGAKILVSKTPVPGMGWFAVLQDPQGTAFAIFEMDEAAK